MTVMPFARQSPTASAETLVMPDASPGFVPSQSELGSALQQQYGRDYPVTP